MKHRKHVNKAIQSQIDWIRTVDIALSEIARHAGVTRAALQAVFNDDWNPKVSTIVGIAHARDVLEKRLAKLGEER